MLNRNSKILLLSLAMGLGPAQSAFGAGAEANVFVGPQLRDGLLDVDSGIRDSIRDIQDELKQAEFVLTDQRDTATLVLIVVARGIVTNGSLGFSSSSAAGGFGSDLGFVVPNTTPTLTTVLRVGRYERAMRSEGSTWRRAAKTVVDDLLAWWTANRNAVQRGN